MKKIKSISRRFIWGTLRTVSNRSIRNNKKMLPDWLHSRPNHVNTNVPAEISPQMKGSGRFLAFCSRRPSAVMLDGYPVGFTYEQNGEGFPSLEALLPEGYKGVPRRLSLRWEP